MSEDVNISFFLSLFLSLSLCVCVTSFMIKMWQYHPCVSEQKTKGKRKKERKKEKFLTDFVVLPNFGKGRKKLNEI